MKSNKTPNSFNLTESNRCLQCMRPACRVACPVGNNIPAFLQYVKNGELKKAVEIIGHPFGEVCGYVCPHELQCQGSCVLSRRGQSVQMGEVERTVFALNPYKVERKGNKLKRKKIAVVGGGVSGITFAVKTYEQGADVTVYEKDELLSTLKLIPSFRLPTEALTRIEKALKGTFKVVKQAITAKELAQLQRDFDIVYLATGASVVYGLGIDGDELATPYDDFLRGKNLKDNIVVIGGGNTAMDCARLAKRNGCNVTVAYRRTREDMPAFAKEIEQTENEGVQFSFNLAPVKLEAKDGKLLLTLARTVSEGRGKLTVTDETTVIQCDTVVSALGSGFDKSIFGQQQVGEDVRHPLSNVYVGGDAAGGKVVAKAVADALQTVKYILENTNNKRKQ